MKRSFRHLLPLALLLALPILVASSLTACLPASATSGTGGQPTAQSSGQTTAQSSAQTTAEPTFTLAELAQYDGRNGNKAYIAIDGVVYDVTAVAVWDSQLHNNQFIAGKDYSTELKSAPHSAIVLSQAMRVGVLAP